MASLLYMFTYRNKWWNGIRFSNTQVVLEDMHDNISISRHTAYFGCESESRHTIIGCEFFHSFNYVLSSFRMQIAIQTYKAVDMCKTKCSIVLERNM